MSPFFFVHNSKVHKFSFNYNSSLYIYFVYILYILNFVLVFFIIDLLIAASFFKSTISTLFREIYILIRWWAQIILRTTFYLFFLLVNSVNRLNIHLSLFFLCIFYFSLLYELLIIVIILFYLQLTITIWSLNPRTK